MARLLRDPGWQFVGALLTLLFGAWAVYTFFIAREVRELQIVVLANSSLIEIEQDVANEIDILYKDQQVNNLG